MRPSVSKNWRRPGSLRARATAVGSFRLRYKLNVNATLWRGPARTRPAGRFATA
jgi:hypothetical protein